MARVLVIDDDADVRWTLRLGLERAGHEVLVADDGLRGVAMAQRQRPDVIVLDLMMPVMDGYGALEALAGDERTRGLPVLVLTAKALPEVEAHVAEAGALRFLTKPIDPEALSAAIDEAVADARGGVGR